jgi:hypothetical protein
MTASHVAAAIFNAHRTKTSDRWFTYMDFHPQHAQPERRKSGQKMNQRITEHLEQTGTVEWLSED